MLSQSQIIHFEFLLENTHNIIRTHPKQMEALTKLKAPGNWWTVIENIYVYNGADPIGESDSIEVVIEYILPTSFGGTTLANIEWLIGAATPFKNVMTLAEMGVMKKR